MKVFTALIGAAGIFTLVIFVGGATPAYAYSIYPQSNTYPGTPSTASSDFDYNVGNSLNGLLTPIENFWNSIQSVTSSQTNISLPNMNLPMNIQQSIPPGAWTALQPVIGFLNWLYVGFEKLAIWIANEITSALRG